MKLNFRQAERHMPAMFNGKATAYTEDITSAFRHFHNMARSAEERFAMERMAT